MRIASVSRRFAEVRPGSPRFAEVRTGTQRFAKVRQVLQGSARFSTVLSSLLRFSAVFCDSLRFAEVRSGDKICLVTSKLRQGALSFPQARSGSSSSAEVCWVSLTLAEAP